MEGKSRRVPHRMSLGEKKLVSIATVLAMKPRMLALDEPTAALDARSRRRLTRVLQQLDETIVVATHDLSLVSEVLERTVVISEREGNENEPMFRLSEVTRSAAFDQHPYAQQIIGKMQDLRTISRDDLYNHYQQYYTPGNAVLAIAGDFNTEDLIKELTQKYADIPVRGVSPKISVTPENSISKSDQITVEGHGDTVYVQISYRAPKATDDDFFALIVLDSLLTGPASLSMFGGGSISNKTSRLYRKLVENDRSVNISGGLQATIDPFLYDILALTSPEKDAQLIIKAISLSWQPGWRVTNFRLIRHSRVARLPAQAANR